VDREYVCFLYKPLFIDREHFFIQRPPSPVALPTQEHLRISLPSPTAAAAVAAAAAAASWMMHELQASCQDVALILNVRAVGVLNGLFWRHIQPVSGNMRFGTIIEIEIGILYDCSRSLS